MAIVTYNNKSYQPGSDESVLDMFIRNGVNIPFSCRAGVCHTCRHKATKGTVPAASQKGLSPVYRHNNFFLLCKCIPDSDLVIEQQEKSEKYVRMTVTNTREEDNKRIRIELSPHTNMGSRPNSFNLYTSPQAKPIPCTTNGQLEEHGVLTAWFDAEPLMKEGIAISDLKNSDVDIQLAPEKPDNGVIQEAGLTRSFPDPQPDLWIRLDNGKLLMAALRKFYKSVYEDDLLSPYFSDVTMARIIEKQFNFLSQAITGEKVYFGERPRNAHHWMVISQELIDHRESLMRSALAQENVHRIDIERLITIETRYSEDIVKSSPWPKVIFGREVAVDGFESMILDASSLCDNCLCEISSGDRVIYHTRTGKVFCNACQH